MPPAIMAHPDLRNPYKKVGIGPEKGATVLVRDKVVVLERIQPGAGLWVLPEDLTQINGFVLKPEGACLDELCIPLKQDTDLLKTVDGQQWVNATAFADLMEQAYVVDEDARVWSFGEMPATRQSMFANAQVPEFEIPDRQGNVVSCQLDVSVWQSIYEELNDPDFVIISAAQDTGGEAVAGPIFDAAKASYIQIVDVNHAISSAFNFVNVPSAAWVDETGRIVRVDEGTYAKTHPFGGTDAYAPALKDWVRNGAASQYVQAAATVTENIRKRTPEQEQAEDLTLSAEGSAGESFMKFRTEFTQENILEPDIAIVDPHHHLWLRNGYTYLLPELAADMSSGHNIVASVFAECHSMYRQGGPLEERSLGETEFVRGQAAMSASGEFGSARACDVMFGNVDVMLGAQVEPLLEKHVDVSGGRFRGIRISSGWHSDDAIHNVSPVAQLLLSPQVSAVAKVLTRMDMTLDCWVYHTQLTEVAALADEHPDLTIVLNHVGSPILGGPYQGKTDEVFDARPQSAAWIYGSGGCLATLDRFLY
ncbi:unnamed protein product [Symbiodinium necroappetens]|uniref:Amidohydrolase-related domain-containing protein n=1 Tax=Symbiodinium necroappetens TaxID=1628268 RepID=A0A812INS8_9DINO|nr:unnamed protein product [Symbiodinium necroappetens]